MSLDFRLIFLRDSKSILLCVLSKTLQTVKGVN